MRTDESKTIRDTAGRCFDELICKPPIIPSQDQGYLCYLIYLIKQKRYSDITNGIIAIFNDPDLAKINDLANIFLILATKTG
jgi:hypothetical protein